MNEQSEHTGIAEDPADETRTLHVDVPRGTVVLAATPIGNTADASARLVALLERAADMLRILRRGAQLQQIVHLHQAHTAAVFLIGRGELPGGRDDRLRLLAGDERDARRRHGIARCK